MRPASARDATQSCQHLGPGPRGVCALLRGGLRSRAPADAHLRESRRLVPSRRRAAPPLPAGRARGAAVPPPRPGGRRLRGVLPPAHGAGDPRLGLARSRSASCRAAKCRCTCATPAATSSRSTGRTRARSTARSSPTCAGSPTISPRRPAPNAHPSSPAARANGLSFGDGRPPRHARHERARVRVPARPACGSTASTSCSSTRASWASRWPSRTSAARRSRRGGRGRRRPRRCGRPRRRDRDDGARRGRDRAAAARRGAARRDRWRSAARAARRSSTQAMRALPVGVPEADRLDRRLGRHAAVRRARSTSR